MSGHSKWSTIKRQKAAGDLKRGQIFTKLGKAITIAVQKGRGVTDFKNNFRLRIAIEKAREANMPKENIKKAIDRGSRKGKRSLNLEEVVYEGYGLFGAALIIEALTDNKQRTTSQIKHALERAGGRLVEPGSVSYLFKRQGLAIILKNVLSEEQVLEKVVESGASDMEVVSYGFKIYTEDQKLHKVVENLKKSGLKVKESELIYRPKSLISLTEKDKAKKILKLMESLESLDDVYKVFANFDIPEGVI